MARFAWPCLVASFITLAVYFEKTGYPAMAVTILAIALISTL